MFRSWQNANKIEICTAGKSTRGYSRRSSDFILFCVMVEYTVDGMVSPILCGWEFYNPWFNLGSQPEEPRVIPSPQTMPSFTH